VSERWYRLHHDEGCEAYRPAGDLYILNGCDCARRELAAAHADLLELTAERDEALAERRSEELVALKERYRAETLRAALERLIWATGTDGVPASSIHAALLAARAALQPAKEPGQ
jgi:hypothetical protein